MTIVLDQPVHIGQTVVAALVQNTIGVHPSTRHIAVTGQRRPVALLILRGTDLRAFTPSGESLPRDAIERICPGAIARMAAGAPCAMHGAKQGGEIPDSG